MSGIAGIIASGTPPGYPQGRQNPNCADLAVPRAFKDLEKTKSARDIAKRVGYSVDKIKKIWNIK